MVQSKSLILAAAFLALPVSATACDREAGGFGRFSAFSAMAHQGAFADASQSDPLASQRDWTQPSTQVSNDVSAEPVPTPVDAQASQSSGTSSSFDKSESGNAKPIAADEQTANKATETVAERRITS